MMNAQNSSITKNHRIRVLQRNRKESLNITDSDCKFQNGNNIDCARFDKLVAASTKLPHDLRYPGSDKTNLRGGTFSFSAALFNEEGNTLETGLKIY